MESAEILTVTELPAPPERPDQAHKGTFGRALIVGGSRGMSGAACLAGVAALRSGAGLVHVATPKSLIPCVAGYEPSYLTIPLDEDCDGRVTLGALPHLAEVMAKQSAVAIGPGLGRSDDLDELVATLFRSVGCPMVVDADGLNALAQRREAFTRQQLTGPRLLTPHPGEFSRLTGLSIAEIEADRTASAVNFALTHDVVLLLKGRATLITDGRRIAINMTGNSGMATGGTGDVLTGLIVGLLAQGMEPFDAAQLGAHLHGRAGDLAAMALSQPGLIASDLPRFLGPAWLSLAAERSGAHPTSGPLV